MTEDIQPSGSTELKKDETTWAVLAHLSAFVVGFLGPLFVWLAKRDEMQFVEDQAKEALNFNISIMIYMLVGLVVPALTIILAPLAVLVMPILGIFFIIVVIRGALKSSKGERYRYPFCLRLIK